MLQVDLFTGRQHQIRVHAQHLGCPLVGDSMYGDKALDKQTVSRSDIPTKL